MRIVDRKGFLDLPAGTLFCPGTLATFNNLYVKGETILRMDEIRAGDFYELPLCDFEYGLEDADNPNEDYIEAFIKMQNKGEHRPLRISMHRNGVFDREALYLIFERDDLLKLKAHAHKALALLNKE